MEDAAYHKYWQVLSDFYKKCVKKLGEQKKGHQEKSGGNEKKKHDFGHSKIQR